MESPHFIPRILKSRHFYSQTACEGAPWEWNRLQQVHRTPSLTSMPVGDLTPRRCAERLVGPLPELQRFSAWRFTARGRIPGFRWRQGGFRGPQRGPPSCASPFGRLGPLPTAHSTGLCGFTVAPVRVRIPRIPMAHQKRGRYTRYLPLFWCAKGDSNPRPPHSECVTLSPELLARNNGILAQVSKKANSYFLNSPS